MNILIIGYGVVGKLEYDILKKFKPDIYDKKLVFVYILGYFLVCIQKQQQYQVVLIIQIPQIHNPHSSCMKYLDKKINELKEMVWKMQPINDKGETKEEAHEEHDDVLIEGANIEDADKPKFRFGFMKEDF